MNETSLGLPAKQISELNESIELTPQDYFPVNVYDSQIGYRLTKKVMLANIANFILDKYVKPKLSSAYGLSDLAYESLGTLVTKFMLGSNHSLSSMSLALSALGDLGLGDLSSTDYADLRLERFAEKSYATGSLITEPDEYVNGLVQVDGKVLQLRTGKFEDAVPIDAAIDGSSQHAVQNAVIKAELDKKINASDTNAAFSPVEGRYVAGLTQTNGKVTALHTFQLPKQLIDNKLDANSANPVENRVVKAAIENLGISIASDVDAAYVKLSDANAYFKAPAGKFITAIRQENGRIIAIETNDFNEMFAKLEAKINDLIARYEAEIASLQETLDRKYLKLNFTAAQTVTGPVSFNTKINGKITNSDLADRAKWS